MDARSLISLDDIKRARGVLAKYLAPSPLEPSPALSTELGADIYLKLEIFRPTRAFKVRGALNKLDSLDEGQRKRGVVAASAGSHAQGVAYAGWRLGIPATVIMPEAVSETIVQMCRAYGAEVMLQGEVYDDTVAIARAIERREGKAFVHPYADPLIVAGQGTIGLEIIDELPDVDAVVVGVGGGGLIGGIAVAIRESASTARVFGVEPDGADAVTRSLGAGRVVSLEHPHSIADKLVAKSTDAANLELIQRYTDGMVTVSDTAIADAMYDYLEKLSLLVEGAGAAGLAALRERAVELPGKKVVLVVSGGNAPPALLARIIEERAALPAART